MAGPAPSDAQVAEIILVADHLLAAKYYAVASFVALLYDIILTFDTEVALIWSQRWSIAKCLWFINRYLNPLIYVVIIVSFLDPTWPVDVCERFKMFPVAAQITSQFFIAVTMIFRTRALYAQSRTVLAILVVAYLASLAGEIYPLQFGIRLELPPGLTACILTGTPESGLSLISYWLSVTVFDTVVFGLTIYKTISMYRMGVKMPLITLFLHDGLLYFGIIFGANMLNVFTYAFAEPTVKTINATFSHVITVIMLSRIMLNMKGVHSRQDDVEVEWITHDAGYDMQAKPTIRHSIAHSIRVSMPPPPVPPKDLKFMLPPKVVAAPDASPPSPPSPSRPPRSPNVAVDSELAVELADPPISPSSMYAQRRMSLTSPISPRFQDETPHSAAFLLPPPASARSYNPSTVSGWYSSSPYSAPSGTSSGLVSPNTDPWNQIAPPLPSTRPSPRRSIFQMSFSPELEEKHTDITKWMPKFRRH